MGSRCPVTFAAPLLGMPLAAWSPRVLHSFCSGCQLLTLPTNQMAAWNKTSANTSGLWQASMVSKRSWESGAVTIQGLQHKVRPGILSLTVRSPSRGRVEAIQLQLGGQMGLCFQAVGRFSGDSRLGKPVSRTLKPMMCDDPPVSDTRAPPQPQDPRLAQGPPVSV